MNICIPVRSDEGLDSRVFGHFGSAPAFLLVDTTTRACRAIVNANRHHRHGMCSPISSIEGESVDAVVVGGIGAGALGKLAAAGIPVYQARHATVRETVDAFAAGELPAVGPESACGHEGHGGHHHQHRHLHAGHGGH